MWQNIKKFRPFKSKMLFMWGRWNLKFKKSNYYAAEWKTQYAKTLNHGKLLAKSSAGDDDVAQVLMVSPTMFCTYKGKRYAINLKMGQNRGPNSHKLSAK